MNRRQFLLAGSTVATAGLAGCTDILGGDDAGSLGDVSAWLPDPRQVDSNLDHYQFSATSPAALVDAIDDRALEFEFRPNPQFGAVTSTDVDTQIEVDTGTGQSFTVYLGSFDDEWAETNLEGVGYDRVRSIDDLTIYDRNDGDAVAVSSEIAIEAGDSSTDPDAAQLAELILDTEGGEVTRYTDALSDMEVLMDTLPGGHIVEGESFDRVESNAPDSGVFERQVAEGESTTINGREVEETEVLVFLDEGDVVERDIEEYIEESGQFSDYLSRPDYEIDGRSVTITGTSAF